MRIRLRTRNGIRCSCRSRTRRTSRTKGVFGENTPFTRCKSHFQGLPTKWYTFFTL